MPFYETMEVTVDEGDTIVLAQVDPTNRWNGWLNPRIDALSVVQVLDAINRDPEYHADYGQDYTFEDDGLLIITERQWAAEEGDAYVPERLLPDADGLYSLGNYGWCWQQA